MVFNERSQRRSETEADRGGTEKVEANNFLLTESPLCVIYFASSFTFFDPIRPKVPIKLNRL